MFALTPDCDFRAEALDTVSGGHWVVHGLDTHVGVPPLSAVSMYRVWPSGAAATVPRPETELVPTVVEAEPVACAAGEPPEPPYRPPPDPFEQAARSRPKKLLTAATWRPRALDPFLIDLTSTHRFASNTGHQLAGIAPEGVMSVTSQGTLSSGTAAPIDSSRLGRCDRRTACGLRGCVRLWRSRSTSMLKRSGSVTIPRTSIARRFCPREPTARRSRSP